MQSHTIIWMNWLDKREPDAKFQIENVVIAEFSVKGEKKKKIFRVFLQPLQNGYRIGCCRHSICVVYILWIVHFIPSPYKAHNSVQRATMKKLNERISHREREKKKRTEEEDDKEEEAVAKNA